MSEEGGSENVWESEREGCHDPTSQMGQRSCLLDGVRTLELRLGRRCLNPKLSNQFCEGPL